MMHFIKKMRGPSKSPPRVGAKEVILSWVGSFLGIALVAVLHFELLAGTALVMVIGSFGASAVLVYGAVRSPLAQPRNLLGGHVFSALVGVTCFQLFSFEIWLAAALAVSTAIAVMHLTKTLHPPGGATALIAVIGGENIHALGYLYVLIPVASGALLMLVVALIANNIASTRRYPEFWV